MKTSLIISLVLLVISSVSYAELGEDIYSGSSCVNCHGGSADGISGKGQKLKGMDSKRILSFIEEAKTGKGVHKNSIAPTDSCDVGMTDKDAKTMASWLSKS